jgi:hypothetical protein
MIPKEFNLAGLKIKVELNPNLYQERKIVGEARYPSQTISLDSTVLEKESAQQNFYHELIHWIFYILNEDELRNNEKLVDQMAYLLHQALSTSNEMYSAEELGNDI